MAITRRPTIQPDGEQPYDPNDPALTPDVPTTAPATPLTTQPAAPPVGAATQYGGTADAFTGPYAPIAGYDYGKLSDPTHRGEGKYNNDVGWFSQALAATGAQPGAAGMKAISDWLNTQGAKNTYANDQLTFADYGQPIDVTGNYNDAGEGSYWAFQDPRAATPGDLARAHGGGGGADPFGGGQPTLPHAGLDPSLISALLDTGSHLGGPGTAGVYGDSGSVQQMGQDPFSQLITGGLANLIVDQTGRLHSTPQQQAQAMEAARSPYEAARRVQLRNAEGALADRGTLGEPGHQSGLLSGAVQRIEEGLAPSYTGAIADEFGRLHDRENAAGNTLATTLTAGTARQTGLADIAIRSLEQNRLFDQFIAQFGLDKVKVLNDIASGQNDQYLRLLQLYLQRAELAAGGYI